MMKLTLRLPTNIANSRMQWAQPNRARKTYFEFCDVLMMSKLVPEPPQEPPEKAKVRLSFFLHNRMDEDNLTARAKWVLDWLVTRGYLTDDKPQNLRLLKPRQRIDRKNKRIEVELTVVKQ